MNPMRVQIIGVGHYLPERVVTNAELAPLVGRTDDWIGRTTGVLERRRVTGETTVDMAASAIERALQAADLDRADVDLLISASAGRLQTIPCTAAFIHQQLGLPPTAFAFDVDVTCLSFLAAVTVAATMLEQRQCRHAVVVSSEVASGTIDYAQPESAVLFGDAAAAVVLSAPRDGSGSHILHSHFHTISKDARLAQIRGGGTLHHPNHESTTTDMNLFQMRGREIFKSATRHMEVFLDEFFDTVPWKRHEIDRVIPHQASHMATRQLIKRYGFNQQQIAENLSCRGNCVAASLPLMLSEDVQAGHIQRDHRVLLVGTGAGLTLGAMALVY